MPTAEQYEDLETLVDILADHLVIRRIALVLGAGVSIDFGLLSWNDLLWRLYASVGQTPPNDDVYRQAEHFKREHCGSDSHRFMELVREALYSSLDISAANLTANPLLSALGALVMSSLRGSATDVVTFNFDDLVETYLEYHGFVTASVAEQRHWAPHADVTVYHPHGLLPHRAGVDFSEDIVFDQKSYSKLNAEGSGPWRQRILVILRHHFPLFIGLSGRDANLDMLLIEAQRTHIAYAESDPFWGACFCLSGDRYTAGFWRERGIVPIFVTSHSEIPGILFRVCQAAATKRRNA